MEVKLVFLGGKFHHIFQCSVGMIRMKMPDFDNASLVEFGTSVIDCVSHHDEYILSGLVRVDIMKNNDGQLVLNELESLEAGHATLDPVLSGACSRFLSEYWEKVIYECIFTFTLSR